MFTNQAINLKLIIILKSWQWKMTILCEDYHRLCSNLIESKSSMPDINLPNWAISSFWASTFTCIRSLLFMKIIDTYLKLQFPLFTLNTTTTIFSDANWQKSNFRKTSNRYILNKKQYCPNSSSYNSRAKNFKSIPPEKGYRPQETKKDLCTSKCWKQVGNLINKIF
jgi:hypothetical protein